MKLKHPTIWLESKPAIAWALTFSYAVFIFLMSAFPYAPPEPSLLKPLSSTLKHVFEYFVFGFLLLASFRSNSKTRKFAFWFAVLFVAFYGMTDEIHQIFVPYRTASITDVLADVLGGFLGAFFLRPEIFNLNSV